MDSREMAMGELIIGDWNAQGGAVERLPYLGNFMDERCCVLLLQETGCPETTGFQEGNVCTIGETEFYCVMAVVDPIAKIQRCTTAIFVKEDFRSHVINADCDFLQVGRPLCYIDLDLGFRIATIHATANSAESVTEVKSAMNWLYENAPDGKWILMGDFNSIPSSYNINETSQLIPNFCQPITYGGTSNNPSYCRLIYDKDPTQGAGGERTTWLDYAFTSYAHGEENPFTVDDIGNSMIVNEHDDWVSDHNFMQLLLQIPLSSDE